MSGLILVDQPPVHVKPGPGYVDFWSSLVYLGVPILNFMRRAALEGLERDAENIDFSARLTELAIPAAFFVGRNKESNIPSEISDEILAIYKRAIPQIGIVDFLQSGHMIPDAEQEKYVREIASFLDRL
jgi:pimeloyl-ACP methyl ester carboxylesterase